MNVTLEADDKLVDNENQLQHGSVIWILIMSGILYRDNYEKEYFAQSYRADYQRLVESSGCEDLGSHRGMS